MMDKSSAKERIAFLCAELERHNRLYYENDTPEISDAEYDALFRELQQLENQFPELILPETPTARVGGRALEKFQQVTHRLAMISLDNAFPQGTSLNLTSGSRKNWDCRRILPLIMSANRRWMVSPWNWSTRKGFLFRAPPAVMA